MANQAEISAHLDLSVPAVSQLMRELNIDWRQESLDSIRVMYIRRLRLEAAGRSGDDQVRLTQARARDAAASADLKITELAQRLGTLVPAEEMEDVIQDAFAAVRSEVIGMEERLIDILEAETGVRIKPEIIRGVTRAALANLERSADDDAPGGEAGLADVSAAH